MKYKVKSLKFDQIVKWTGKRKVLLTVLKLVPIALLLKLLLNLLLLAVALLFTLNESQASSLDASVLPATNIEARESLPKTEKAFSLESMNQSVWYFNYQLIDKKLFRPVAHGYQNYVPYYVRDSVRNVVSNLDEPSALINNLLQGKWKWSANAGARFVINSTLGVAGIFDVAEKFGLERKQDQFSEVLGYHGIPHGPYIMLPILGPSVASELTTDWIDELYFPIALLSPAQWALKWGLEKLDARANLIPQEALLDNALSPYLFTQQAYLQRVDFRIHDGAPPTPQDDTLIDAYLDEIDDY